MKYIIRWNSGHGDCYDTVEAEDIGEAHLRAYEVWKSEVEDNADYSATPYTKELAEEYCIAEDE